MLGKYPSAWRPVIRMDRGPLPPTQKGGPPGRWGVGNRVASFRFQKRPSKVTGSPRHNRRQISIPSVMRPARCSKSASAASNSWRIRSLRVPNPTPRMSRPWAIRSRVAALCASSTGLRNGASSTAVPSSTRRVRAATAASRVNGSKRGRASSESPAQTESNPAASARSAKSSMGVTAKSPARIASRVGSSRPIVMGSLGWLFGGDWRRRRIAPRLRP